MALSLGQAGSEQRTAKLSVLVRVCEARRSDRSGGSECWLDLAQRVYHHPGLFIAAEVGQGGRVQDVGHAELRIGQTCSARRSGRLVEAACGEVCVREPDVGQV